MEPEVYKCSECGADVVVTDGEMKRACGHSDAGVIAEISAVAYGESSLK